MLAGLQARLRRGRRGGGGAGVAEAVTYAGARLLCFLAGGPNAGRGRVHERGGQVREWVGDGDVHGVGLCKCVREMGGGRYMVDVRWGGFWWFMGVCGRICMKCGMAAIA